MSGELQHSCFPSTIYYSTIICKLPLGRNKHYFMNAVISQDIKKLDELSLENTYSFKQVKSAACPKPRLCGAIRSTFSKG